jgi:hypothetical protein
LSAFFAATFTTPPITRKRKAAEAIADEPLPKAAHGDRKASYFQNREGESPVSSASKKPSTPTTVSMDSDDEFMSDVSSQDDFLGTQGSDDESLGEGAFPSDLCVSFVYVICD